MILRGINLSEVDEKLDENTYVKKIGSEAEVSVLKKRDTAPMLSTSLGRVIQEDKFMKRYVPSNVILFDADLIDSIEYSNSIMTENLSFTIQDGAVRVGKRNKYRGKSGILCTSSVLDYYSRADGVNKILSCKNVSREVLVSSIDVLGLGIAKNLYTDSDMLVGLMYLPCTKGYAVSDNYMEEGTGISSYTGCERDCTNWNEHTLDEWFSRAKITNGGSYAVA